MIRVAHTADIHIRSLSRHDEYREVFQDFIDDCRKQRVDHIFVGGDIFHTKTTGISGEYIDLFRWWLNGMAEVAEVHLTLGNHDGNLTNLHRQDAVTPIVDALNNPRVHLYKKSGTYEFTPGYAFCVYSLFDEPGWKSVKPLPGLVNIACYHGPVWGCFTESEWAVEDGVKVDFFDAYPFTFLGDIHKRQVLKKRDGKPVMVYPGTLIQQNYAEELTHGYMLWEIHDEDDWTVEFRELNNPKPFVTLDYDGDAASLLATAKSYAVGTRFRIHAEDRVGQDAVHTLTESLKMQALASEVTYKIDHKIDTQTIRTEGSTLKKTDLRTPETIGKLLREHHRDAEVDEEDLQDAVVQAKSYLASVASSDDMSRGSKWTLAHVSWDNLFNYGESNSVDFQKLSGIVGLFGANRVGKSSFVGSIMYSLFNTTDRGTVGNLHVCNARKQTCGSKVILDHAGTPYVIERRTTKSSNKKGVTSATTALSLYRIGPDGEVDILNGEARPDTEKTVRSLFGTAEDFLMTSLSAQRDVNSEMISLGASKRSAVLSKFLDLDVFDKMHSLASKDVNGLKSQLKNYQERDWDALIDTKDAEIEDKRALVSELEIKIRTAQTTLDKLRADSAKITSTVMVTQADVDAQTTRVADLVSAAERCKREQEEAETSMLGLRDKMSKAEAVIEDSDISDLKKRLDAQRGLETALLELTHSLDKEKMSQASQKKVLKILEDVPCGDDYPTCKFIKDAHIAKDGAAAQDARVSEATKKVSAAQKKFSDSQESGLKEKIARHEKASDLLSKIKLEIARQETAAEKRKATCGDCETKVVAEKDKLSRLEEGLKNEENAEAVTIRRNIEDFSRKVSGWDREKTEESKALGRAQAQAEKLREEKTARDAILRDMRVKELVASAFSKKGIPLDIIRSQLPVINGEVARILQGIENFTIELQNDEESDSVEIYIDYGDSRRIAELCSGMEKTIASIALRVAMINVSTMPKSDIFIIDEGFGTLDPAGVESCNRLLTSLKKHFRTILVITHVDGIKDVVDHIIEIDKVETDAHVVYP